MYAELFKGLGKMEPEHHIKLNDNASPIVHPPMKVPIGLHEKAKKEFDNIEKTGLIRMVDEPTEWVKLLTFEVIASRLKGANVFTKIDASKGYWQIPLDESSIKLTTFNTPFGLYQFRRLPYRVH